MDITLPDQAQVVVIGAGILGCSTAYHLAKNGCRDVLVLEKHKITSGSTWHAAGAVGQLRSNANITRMLGHSVELYSKLAEETGQDTGWVENGSLRLACNNDRRAEYERAATTARSFGLEMEMLSPAEAKNLFPIMDVDDLVCAAYVPSDGVVNPADVTMALAKGARDQGVRIVEDVKVESFTINNGSVVGVTTDYGEIRCESVVNCAGIWAREIGRLAGVNVPLQPSHHQYLVTEKIDGLARNVPTLRDPDHLTYFKEEVGGLAYGGYELNPIPYVESPIPPDHEFKLMQENIEQFEPLLRGGVKRIPSLETVGIKTWFNGIESFTEDGMFILGESPEVRNFFIGAGFNAFGIASGGGAGKALAEWILAGEAPFDLYAADVRRFSTYHKSDKQVRVRALEGQGRHYAMGWPHDDTQQAGRPFRRSAIYHRLKDNGACFGMKSGWERPNWFAPAGVEPIDQHSFGRQNWFPYVAQEHRSCREAVALFDVSYFAKFTLVGRDSEQCLQRICAANVGHAPEKISYTQMLNDKGGIECDLTVTRIDDNEFYIVTGTGFAIRDFTHIKRNILAQENASLLDVTSAYGTLSVMGPRARDLLSTITEGDLSNESFPFGTWKLVHINGAPVRALRVTFVGELGWELHIPSEYLTHVYDSLKTEGVKFDLKDAGYRAIDSLRLEKGYRIWGSDIGPDYTPYEAGLGFAVDMNKSDLFNGKQTLSEKQGEILTKRLVTFTVNDPDAILHGRETIYRNNERVGWIASAGHGHTIGKDIGLGYVRHQDGVSKEFLENGDYELEVRTRRVPATLHLGALYDPGNSRIRC